MKAYKFTTMFWRVCVLAMTAGSVASASAQTMTEAWVKRFGEIGSSNDSAEKAVKDNSGNLIVAGYSDSGIAGRDWVIIKYSGAGVPLWTNRYSGSSNGSDAPVAIAVDSSDNVFVTGTGVDISSSADYVTIAYSAAGIPLWTNRYNGPANSFDVVRAIALDASGNVFVAGYSTGSGSSYDYATVAYSGAGIPLWTNRYNGPGNDNETLEAMALDSSGNVFITGETYAGSYSDTATIAYSGAGIPLWTNVYNGPGNATDTGRSVNVDANGKVFVTGSSTGIGSGYDYLVLAYSGAGIPLWTNRYNGPGNSSDTFRAVAMDGSGNLYYTGISYRSTSSDSADYATVAYSGAGVPLWTNRFNGPDNKFDYPNAIAVSSSGKVFVTGQCSSGAYTDFGTVAYSSTGVPLWTNLFNGAGYGQEEALAVVTDNSGNAIVAGNAWNGTNADYATIAYSAAGTALWTNRFNGPGIDSVKGMITDGSNIFVIGNSEGTGPNDIVSVVYSGTGLPLWTNRYNGPANVKDEAKTVAVDVAGNIFVSSRSAVSNASAYISSTIAYSEAGVPLWTNRYNASPGDMAVDGSGKVFVTGGATVAYSGTGVSLWTNSPGAGVLAVGKAGNVITGGGYGSKWPACMIFAYSSAGVPLWTNRFHNAAISSDYAQDVAVDDNGNVFLAASANGACATIAYSAGGTPLWTNMYSLGQPVALARAGNGNVYVTIYNPYLGTTRDYATIGYSGDGIPLWTNIYNGPGNSSDIPQALAADGSGNVFVTGTSYSGSSGTSADYATIAYSAAGVPLWTNRYDGPGGNIDQANAVAVDGNGNVFVTGYSIGADGSYDYATIAYSGAGVPLSTNRYNGPAHGSDQPQTKRSLAIAPDGSVLVTGSSDTDDSSATVTDLVTIKYLPQFPPSITIPPTSQTSPPSGNVNFFVTASGSGNLAYQWFFNNAPIPDSTNSNLSLPDATLGYQGDYAVVITNPYGSVTSSVASLTITLPGNNELSGQLLNGGAMQITYSGLADGSYVLERTFNLAPADWIPQATNSAGAGGLLFFTNSPAIGTNNFWRIRSGP